MEQASVPTTIRSVTIKESYGGNKDLTTLRSAAFTEVGAQADDHEQRGVTMLNYGYLGYQAERRKSPAEQREADAQLGQLFAALAQLLCSLAKPVRAMRRRSGPGHSAAACAFQPSARALH
jgi:hypothetical protein